MWLQVLRNKETFQYRNFLHTFYIYEFYCYFFTTILSLLNSKFSNLYVMQKTLNISIFCAINQVIHTLFYWSQNSSCLCFSISQTKARYADLLSENTCGMKNWFCTTITKRKINLEIWLSVLRKFHKKYKHVN